MQNLEHLALVAGMIDEIGIVEKINQLVGQQPGEVLYSPLYARSRRQLGATKSFLTGIAMSVNDNSESIISLLFLQYSFTGGRQSTLTSCSFYSHSVHSGDSDSYSNTGGQRSDTGTDHPGSSSGISMVSPFLKTTLGWLLR